MNATRIAAGLDAGSARTRCVLCALEPDQTIRFLGCGEAEARGWIKGRISDQAALSETVRLAVQDAEVAAGALIEQVVVGVGGSAIHAFNSRGLYEFGRKREIEPSDLGYAAGRAAEMRLEEDRCVLQVVAQDFTLDGRAGYRNPSGISARRLEANVHVITASGQDHQCILAAVHRAHLAVEETVFEPLAAAYAALLPEHRERGAALVVVGAHSTDLVVYQGDALLLAASVPIGSYHFTHDVAYCLCVTDADAERLKQEYGCAILGLTADSTLIEVPSAEGRVIRETTRRQLNEILEARAIELFDLVRAELVAAGVDRELGEGVVLTGGGALLNGMCDVAERVLNCQARYGLPLGILKWPEDLNHPAWTTAAGLAMYSARLKLRRERRNGPGLVSMLR